MRVKIELFGATRDFSEQNLLELDLEKKSTINKQYQQDRFTQT